MSTDNLDILTDADLSDLFAVTMGVTCDPDNYATSADAVLPWLERLEHGWACDYDVKRDEYWVTLPDPVFDAETASATTFPRAACIALIRAKQAAKNP